MAVFSDADLLAALDAKELGLDPFVEKSLTPNGYDLSVGEVMVPDVHGETRFREGTVVIPGRERFLVSTREVLRMPPAACGQLWLRTTWARRGLMAQFGKIEAGFEGTLTLPGFNAAREPVELPVGERYCQLVLERLETPPRKLYAEASGNYQGQRGVTLARRADEP